MSIRDKIMALYAINKNNFATGERVTYHGGLSDAADIAEAEVQRLEDENERLRSALADQLIDDTLMKELVIKAGNAHMEMEGGVCKLLAESFTELLVKHNAENYIEASFTSKLFLPEEFIVVTVQKTSGKTPHQLRREADLEVQRLEEKLNEANSELLTYYNDWSAVLQEKRRLEARVRELVDVVKYLTEDMALNNGDRELVERVLGGG